MTNNNNNNNNKIKEVDLDKVLTEPFDGTCILAFELNEFFIARMNSRYHLNENTNKVGRKLKQTGEYITLQPIYEYPFFYKGPQYILVYSYLMSLMIKSPQGGWKTEKTKNLFKKMALDFDCKFEVEELEEAFQYLVREGFLAIIYDGVKYRDSKDPERIDWITAPEAIHSFEAMMQEKERKNKGKNRKQEEQKKGDKQ